MLVELMIAGTAGIAVALIAMAVAWRARRYDADQDGDTRARSWFHRWRGTDDDDPTGSDPNDEEPFERPLAAESRLRAQLEIEPAPLTDLAEPDGKAVRALAAAPTAHRDRRIPPVTAANERFDERVGAELDGRSRSRHGPSTADPKPPSRVGSALWSVGSRTDIGYRRDRNEDVVLATPQVVAVADGVGGGPAGDTAARVVVQTVHRTLTRSTAPVEDLELAVHQAAAALFGAAQVDPELRGMSTTLDLIVLGSAHPVTVHGAHIGDGAVWLVPATGRPTRLTTHHRDERGRLSRSLSTEPDVRCEYWRRIVRTGDRLVVASDGFHYQLHDHDLAANLLEEVRDDSPEEAARSLVRAALGAGGGDNVSVVVAEYGLPGAR